MIRCKVIQVLLLPQAGDFMKPENVVNEWLDAEKPTKIHSMVQTVFGSKPASDNGLSIIITILYEKKR